MLHAGHDPKSVAAETIIGEISVSAQLAIGSERLKLLLTTNRLIFAHMEKTGAGALAAAPLLGKLGSVLEGLLRRGGRPVARTEKDPIPQEILEAHKDNFAIDYNDIVQVELDHATGMLQIITREDKFRFFTSMDPRSVLGLLRKTLDAKVTTS